MTDQDRGGSWSDEVHGLAPGFLLSFLRPIFIQGAGHSSAIKAKFPHIRVMGFGEATPDLLMLVGELSAPGDRTVDEVIETTSDRTGASRERLQRFAAALRDGGHLVPAAPPSQWSDAEPLDLADAPPITDLQQFQVAEGEGFLADGGHYVWCDHSGVPRLRLNAAEISAIRAFGDAATVEQAWTQVTNDPLARTMSRASFDELVMRLRAHRLLRTVDTIDQERTAFEPTAKHARDVVIDDQREIIDEFKRTVMSRPGRRAAIVPVNDDHNMAPLSLGLLVAYAQELDGGRLRDRYDFVPMFLADGPMLLEWTEQPAIFLFSNYIWNVERNLKLSALVKDANPANITIHGGPSTPKYTGDCEQFFADNTHVDITVRGEGEATFAAILDALDPTNVKDFSKLGTVAGLSFRGPTGVVHTEDRERIAELDSIPSPYLLGLFDPFGRAHIAAVVESNRGCPYGCTFCDWGSATLSRIRMFDLDRVKAELEWSARNELLFVSLCDANFGILERDVDIAEHIAAMRKHYGFPKTAALNYAKNTMKHLRRIIDIFTDAGLVIEPTVAVQSMDTTTLKIVRRQNIKTEKYDELADQFRRAGLSLATDVMMGLPGSTVESFKSDLQKCTDRDVRARCNQTVLLPNSPMNDPSYREEHGIVAKPHEPIKQTKSFTRADFDEMDRIRIAFYVFDNFGVLRHVARFVRSEVGLKEVDFYSKISRDAIDEPLRWPMIASFVRMMEGNLAPPSSWSLFLDEVGRYVVNELGVEPGTALDTTLQIQLAHLPAPSRTMPQSLELTHDFVAWHETVFEIRSQGHRDDWETLAPRLQTFGPGEIKVSDPNDICGTMVGKPRTVLAWNILGWDMNSPVARAK